MSKHKSQVAPLATVAAAAVASPAPAADPAIAAPEMAPLSAQQESASAAPVERQEQSRPSDEEILNDMDESDLERLNRLASLAEARRKARGTVSREDAELVRIYNKGRRRFDHAPYQAQPGSFCTVPRFLAKQWLRDYPNDFVAGDAALKTIDAGAAALQDANKKIADLEAQLKAAKAGS